MVYVVWNYGEYSNIVKSRFTSTCNKLSMLYEAKHSDVNQVNVYVLYCHFAVSAKSAKKIFYRILAFNHAYETYKAVCVIWKDRKITWKKEKMLEWDTRLILLKKRSNVVFEKTE